MLTPDVISAIEIFLSRVELRGSEVPAFNKVLMQLAALKNELSRSPEVPSPATSVNGASTETTA